MPAPEAQNLLNMLAASNPIVYGFVKVRRAANAAGFIAYCGIISVADALWMWMVRHTAFQLRTITSIVAFALFSLAVSPYPRLRRGFEMYCLILLAAGLDLAISHQSSLLLLGIRPQIPAFALIAAGLVVYLIQTRFVTGTVLLFFACLAASGFFWFYPICFNPLILSTGGFALIFAGCILRSLVLLKNYY